MIFWCESLSSRWVCLKVGCSLQDGHFNTKNDEYIIYQRIQGHQTGFSIPNHPFWGTPIYGNPRWSWSIREFFVHPQECRPGDVEYWVGKSAGLTGDIPYFICSFPGAKMQVISVIPCDFGIFSDAFGEFTGRIVTVSSVSSFAGYWIKSKSPGKRTTSLKK